MNKENILFGIIGLLAGLIVGFMFANSVNKNAVSNAPAPAGQTAGLPEGHPGIDGTGGAPAGPMSPQTQAALEKAKNEPDNFDAQIKAAELYYQIQKYDGAIEYLTRANKIQPDNYEVIVHLANANFDSNKYVEAEKWYSKALEKKADDVNTRTDLGLTFIFRDPPDYDRAIKEFRRSLEIEPNHPQTLQNLTVAYTKKGDAENARATLASFEKADAGNQTIPRLREDIEKIGKQ